MSVRAYYGTNRPPVGARRVRMATRLVTVGRAARFGSRLRGTISRGYTRRTGYYGRYTGSGGMGGDRAGELKFNDKAIDDAVISQTGTITTSPCVIPQGTLETERIGRKCTIRHFSWKYRLDLPELDAGATPPNSDIVRVIIYQDKQTNGAAPTVLDILQTADLTSHYQLVNKGRFNIFLDRTHDLNYTAMASDGAGVVSTCSIEKYFTFNKACNVTMEYSGVTGNITTMKSNHIGVLVMSATGNAGMVSTVRVRYSDN